MAVSIKLESPQTSDYPPWLDTEFTWGSLKNTNAWAPPQRLWLIGLGYGFSSPLSIPVGSQCEPPLTVFCFLGRCSLLGG